MGPQLWPRSWLEPRRRASEPQSRRGAGAGPLPGATERGRCSPGLPQRRRAATGAPPPPSPSQSRPAVRPQPPLTPEALGQDTRAQPPAGRLGSQGTYAWGKGCQEGGLPPPSAAGSAVSLGTCRRGRGALGQRWGKGQDAKKSRNPTSTPRGRDTTADKWPKSYWVEKDG